MKNNVSVACLTADLLGGRSFSINYHLFTVINAICENISISSIHLYTTSINDFSSGSLQEIQADFHIHFPCSRIHVHEMDSRDISLAGKALSGFDLLVCEMFVWSDSIKYARSMNSGVKVIYCVHSILQQEWIANAQNKWVGFEHFHRLQRELVAVADHLVFDSCMDREYASRFFPDILHRSSVIYPIPVPICGFDRTWDVTRVSFPKFRLLYAGRWEYRKGIEQLVDSFFHCHTQYGMELHILSDYLYMENFDRLFLSPDNAVKFKSLLDRGAISLTGWQAGFNTDRAYSKARIKRLDTERVESELARNRVVVVAGFQGLNRSDDITTLGRGGSDTSAVALAAALHADRCQIFTDVEGVYTADPRKIPKATKLKEITFDEMLELASLGAQVLNNRSVELAKKYNVELEVISSINPVPGTVVKEECKVEGMLIKGVAKDTDVAVLTVKDVPDVPGMSFKIFSLLAQKNINVDIILQTTGRDGKKDMSFTVPLGDAESAVAALKNATNRIGGGDVNVDKGCAKVSIVGAGMQSHSGVASTMFEALFNQNINIKMISTSEIKISVIIDEADADKAVAAIHDAFIN